MSNYIEIDDRALLQYVDPYPGRSGDDEVWDDCTRCGGLGYLPGYEFIDGARCWKCFGHKGSMMTVRQLRQRESGRVSRRNAEVRAQLKRQQDHNDRMAEYERQYPVLADWHAQLDDPFMLDLWTKAFEYDLSERQVAAAARVIENKRERAEKRAAEQAELQPVVAGKGTFEGEVLRVKLQDSDYGSSWKMLVLEGRKFKLWGTIPGALLDAIEHPEALVGQTVRFNATAEASRDDQTFGFFKRPTKPSIVTK